MSSLLKKSLSFLAGSCFLLSAHSAEAQDGGLVAWNLDVPVPTAVGFAGNVTNGLGHKLSTYVELPVSGGLLSYAFKQGYDFTPQSGGAREGVIALKLLDNMNMLRAADASIHPLGFLGNVLAPLQNIGYDRQCSNSGYGLVNLYCNSYYGLVNPLWSALKNFRDTGNGFALLADKFTGNALAHTILDQWYPLYDSAATAIAVAYPYYFVHGIDQSFRAAVTNPDGSVAQSNVGYTDVFYQKMGFPLLGALMGPMSMAATFARAKITGAVPATYGLQTKVMWFLLAGSSVFEPLVHSVLGDYASPLMMAGVGTGLHVAMGPWISVPYGIITLGGSAYTAYTASSVEYENRPWYQKLLG